MSLGVFCVYMAAICQAANMYACIASSHGGPKGATYQCISTWLNQCHL